MRTTRSRTSRSRRHHGFDWSSSQQVGAVLCWSGVGCFLPAIALMCGVPANAFSLTSYLATSFGLASLFGLVIYTIIYFSRNKQ